MVNSKNVRNFAIANEAKDSPKTNAQVAELVDALVSKTNEVTLVPVRSRPRVLKGEKEIFLLFFIYSHNNSPPITTSISITTIFANTIRRE